MKSSESDPQLNDEFIAHVNFSNTAGRIAFSKPLRELHPINLVRGEAFAAKSDGSVGRGECEVGVVAANAKATRQVCHRCLPRSFCTAAAKCMLFLPPQQMLVYG
ncbi:hypothetical protein Aduo_012305 [Ancylostoma duodenale]